MGTSNKSITRATLCKEMLIFGFRGAFLVCSYRYACVAMGVGVYPASINTSSLTLATIVSLVLTCCRSCCGNR